MGALPSSRMNPLSTLVVRSVLLAILTTSAWGPTTQASEQPAASAVTTSLPSSLVRALSRKDPFALADTTLPRLSDLDEQGRAQVAEQLASWDIGRRVAAWAFLQVGTPYELGPLGEEAPPDTGPVISFATTDCAVLNLVSAAMAHAREAGGEREAMARANYRGGLISYATRLHFTTDRLDSSPYYHDITDKVGERAFKTRSVVLNHRADGSRWIDIDWSRTRDVLYVPRGWGSHFERWHDQGTLPAALGVAFVKLSALSDGLDVVHESFLWRGRTFLHASSRTGRVMTMPWIKFLRGPGREYDGFVLFEYR
jgi:hypothetical protein